MTNATPTPSPLSPGPAMDAELGEIMGVEPEGWRVQHQVKDRLCATFETEAEAQWWASMGPDRVVTPVYPPLSTTDAGMGVVLDWLVSQGWNVMFYQYADGTAYCGVFSEDDAGPMARHYGKSRFEAVARAALATRGCELSGISG